MTWAAFEMGLRIAQVVVIPFVAYIIRMALKLHAEMKRNKQAIAEISGKQDELEAKVSEIQNTQVHHGQLIAHMPDAQNYHDLALSIEKMNGNLKEIVAHVKGSEKMVEKLTATMNRQELYLLNSRKD
jgi:hypothetical protein